MPVLNSKLPRLLAYRVRDTASVIKVNPVLVDGDGPNAGWAPSKVIKSPLPPSRSTEPSMSLGIRSLQDT